MMLPGRGVELSFMGLWDHGRRIRCTVWFTECRQKCLIPLLKKCFLLLLAPIFVRPTEPATVIFLGEVKPCVGEVAVPKHRVFGNLINAACDDSPGKLT